MNSFGGKTILLIEDNPGDVRLTTEAFQEANFSVNIMVANDGEEAIKRLKQEPPYESLPHPNLILMDLNLPKKSGPEILKEIKGHPILRRIPIIGLSTSSSEKDIANIYDLHINCYLNKPVDFDDFFNLIQLIERFWLQQVVLADMNL